MAMIKIWSHRSALAAHLKIVMESPDSTFSPTTKEIATSLRKFLLNKNVMALMALNLDIQVLFKMASTTFQLRHASVIGKIISFKNQKFLKC